MGRKKLKESEKGDRTNVYFPRGRLKEIKEVATKKKMNFSSYINWLYENRSKK